MGLHKLSPAEGSRKTRKRIGRGMGSGIGKTGGKGVKGQTSRSGGSTRLGFEGGQMPLYRRLPKRGFNNTQFATVYDVVNLDTFADHFENGATVDVDALEAKGLLKPTRNCAGLKVLANGELKVALTVRAAKFSASAVSKIEAAGGKAEVV
jgi:large subunit ribosomal protein L15